MKVLTYEYEKMLRAGRIMNELHVLGVNQARLVAELGDILDSGKPGEIIEKKGPPGKSEGKLKPIDWSKHPPESTYTEATKGIKLDIALEGDDECGMDQQEICPD